MIQPITKERWQEAQIAEAGYHANSQDDAEHYRRSYQTYFRYLGMGLDQGGKQITEIGSGPYPAVSFCKGILAAVVVEPLWFATLKELAMQGEIIWQRQPFEEDYEWHSIGDEVWILNCLQHVADPEAFIEKCKQTAPVIRFFEPIDFGVSDCHPHTYSIDDFIRWFGHAERYKGGSDEGFHTADCAYGTWRA